MDHSEIDDIDISFAPLDRRRGAGEDQWRTSADVVVVPPSPPTQTAAFRCQRINFAAAPPLAPPLLHHQSPCLLSNNNNNNNNKIHPNAVVNSKTLSSAQDDNLAQPLTMAKKKEAIGTIPIRPSFHIPERTAVQISEDSLPMNTLLDRALQYLKEHSISYECEPDTGCLECVSPSMISFAIQLWRGNNNKQIHVEVRRRDGCAIELNSIRRSFLRHVQGGLPEQPQQHQLPPSRRRPMSSVGGAESYSNNYQPSMKRRRSLSPYTGAGAGASNGREDALILCLRLLGSPLRSQQKLGLETLTVLTNSKLVGPMDAVIISRALVVGDSPLGLQLQQRLGDLMQREFQPALLLSANGGSDPCHASPNALLYNIALRAISNALEQVSSSSSSSSIGLLINLDSTFWKLTVACLLFSLERGASHNPHDATLAAKCIRFLLPAQAHAERVKAQAPFQHQATTKSVFQPLPLRASLQRTVELGQAHHVSLAEESKKTLCYFQA